MIGQACDFVFNAVGAHALGPARYGVLAASMALLSFVTPLLAAVQAVASREARRSLARRELGKVTANASPLRTAGDVRRAGSRRERLPPLAAGFPGCSTSAHRGSW